jgi:hypothetical protein
MRFCQDHWDRLRAAITERGLSALVAEGGEKAAANLVSEINEGRTVDNYDPLMSAHMAIVSNAARMIGPAAIATPAGYPECPICLLTRLHDEECQGPPCLLPRDGTAFDGWIDRAADDEVAAWKELQP